MARRTGKSGYLSVSGVPIVITDWEYTPEGTNVESTAAGDASVAREPLINDWTITGEGYYAVGSFPNLAQYINTNVAVILKDAVSAPDFNFTKTGLLTKAPVKLNYKELTKISFELKCSSGTDAVAT